MKRPPLIVTRLLWFAGELTLAAGNFMIACAFQRKERMMGERARWLQHTARRLLQVFGVKSLVVGGIPSSGLLVCNHLSYLDVLVLGALAPATFVAKEDVKSWPVFGWLASRAGTIYVRRENRGDIGRVTQEMQTALDAGVLVVLFPEGTSSGGETVLPFKSSLLEPATRQTHPLWAGVIHYELDDGDAAEEVCYWKDMTFVPHLINLLGKRGVRAGVRFSQLRGGRGNRKELALQLHSEVLQLKSVHAG